MMAVGREVAMRVVLIGLAGIAASSAIYGLSHLADGFLGASAYVVALLLAPISIGIAIAMAINERLDPPIGPMTNGRRWSEQAELHRCGCGSPMIAMNSAWVCSVCDLTPARN
jgi:hypothetical protein